MADIEELSDEIRNTFCRYKEKQQLELLNTLNDVRSCECNHKFRINAIDDRARSFKQLARFYQVVLGMLVVLLIFGIYFLWLARYYNIKHNYGGGGCTSSFSWPMSDCPVAF